MENINIKCVIVGDGAIGKTSLLLTYSTSVFPEKYEPTVFENYSANVIVDEKRISLVLWDTAGQEGYDHIRPLSYTQTDVFLVGYSVVSRTSFDNVKTKWVPEIKRHEPKVPIILIGTKIDLIDDSETINRLTEINQVPVTLSEGEALGKEIGAYCHLVCSALTQQGIRAIFEHAVRCILHKKSRKTIGCCTIF